MPQQQAAKSPQRHGRKLRVQRQRVRHDARNVAPAGSSGTAILYTVHKASQRRQPVGRTGRRWLAEEVDRLASPSTVAPETQRSPTIGPVTKCTTKCPADAWLLMQGTEVPERRRGYLGQKSSPWAGAHGRRKTAATPQTSTRETRDKRKAQDPEDPDPARTPRRGEKPRKRETQYTLFHLRGSWVDALSHTPAVSRLDTHPEVATLALPTARRATTPANKRTRTKTARENR